MNCERAQTLISGLIDNEITFEDRESVDRHIHECEECFASFLKLKEDSARLEEAFAALRPIKEQFTSRTSALIAERERPHSVGATRSALDARPILSRIVVPAGISALASAAAFVLMAVYGGSSTSDGNDHRTRAGGFVSGERDGVFFSSSASSRSFRKSPGGSRPSSVDSDSAPPQTEALDSSSRANSDGSSNSNSESLLSGTDVQDIIDQLISAVQHNDQSQIQGLQDRLLSASSVSQKIIAGLIERFRSADDQLVREALAGLLTSIQIQDDSLGQFFLSEMAETSVTVPVKRLLVYGLVNHPYPGSEALLEEILIQENEDPVVKIKAVDALGVLRSDRALEVLLTVPLRDKNDQVRIEAIRVLAEFGDPGLIETYLAIIRSRTEQFDVQKQALEAVTRVAPDRETARATVEEIMGDGTPRAEIRARAKTLFIKLNSDH